MERSTSKKKPSFFLSALKKVFFAFLVLLGLIVICSIFVVRDNNLIAPLEYAFSKVINDNVSISSVNYNLIHPQVINIKGISSDSIKVSELYVEFDIVDSLTHKELTIKNLVLAKPELINVNFSNFGKQAK